MGSVGPWWRSPSNARGTVGQAIGSAPLTFAYTLVLLGTTLAPVSAAMPSSKNGPVSDMVTPGQG